MCWGREALAEEIDRLLKQKQRRVLRGGGKGSLGAGVNRVSGEPVVLGHQQGIVQIEVGSAPQLRNHEVEWGRTRTRRLG